MVMHNPPHPGEIVKELCIDPLGLSVAEIAEGLGVPRKTLAALLDGQSTVSVEMAIRLSKAFGASAETWLRHQMKYDLWHVRKREEEIKVKVFFDPSKQESSLR